MASRLTYVKPRPPYELAQFDEHILAAVKSLAEGTANPAQQIAAFKWIANDLCGIGDLGYFPDSARDSDLAAGKRWVGLQLTALVNFRPVQQEKDR